MDDYHAMAYKLDVVCSIMIFFLLVLLPAFVLMTVKVARLVWPKEKAVPILLSLMCTTLFSAIVFYVFLMIGLKNPQWWCRVYIGEDLTAFTCTESFIDNAPSFILANAVILNLNQWVHFKLKITATIKSGFSCETESMISSSEMSDSQLDKQVRKARWIEDGNES